MAKKGIEAGRAYVKAWWDNSAVFRGIKAMRAGVQRAGSGLKTAGGWAVGLAASIVTPLVAAAKTFADMGSDMLDLSQRTGVAVEPLSELSYAAQQSGADVATLETGLKTMAKTIAGVQGKAKPSLAILRQLGLTAADLEGKTPDEQFKVFAEAISRVADPSVRAALAMKVFGKAGTQLLPLMQNGAKGIEELQAEARRLGITMSTEDAVAAEKFGDQISTLSAVLKAKLFSAGAAVAPVLSRLVDRLTAAAVWGGRFIDSNRALVGLLFKVALVVGGAGAVFLGLGFALTSVVSVGTALATALGAVFAVVGFMLSPVGLVVAALTAAAGAGAYFAHESGLLGDVLDWLQERFGPLAAMATDAFRVIKDALSEGEFAAAGKVAMAALRLALAKGIESLRGAWINFQSFLATVFTNLSAQVQSIWAGMTGAMITGLAKGAATALGLLSGLAEQLGLDDQAKTLNHLSTGVSFGGTAAAAASSGEVAGIETRRRETEVAIAEEAERRRAALTDETADAALTFTTAMNEAKGATEDAAAERRAAEQTDAMVAEAEADRKKLPPAAPAKAAAAAKAAVNTATRVDSAEGQAALFKALGGAPGKITPGDRLIAGAIAKQTAEMARQHREAMKAGTTLKVEEA